VATNKRKRWVTPAGVEVKSGLELKIATSLEEQGIEYGYETVKFAWYDKYPRALCSDCGGSEIYQKRSYTPDFIFPNGVIVESKGRLTRRDRKIITGVRTANPEIDLRLVFDKDNRINKGSNTRYSDWAERNKFQYAMKGAVPEEWFK